MRKSKKIKAEISTDYGKYVVVLEREPDMGGYTVEALDVQGAVSWGKTVAEAKRMIAEAIKGVVEARMLANAEKQGQIRIIRRSKHAVAA